MKDYKIQDMGSRYTITIPKMMMEMLRWKKGDRLQIEADFQKNCLVIRRNQGDGEE